MLSRANLDQFTRLDAEEGIFFLRQLEHIQSKLYEIEYPEIKHRELIPVNGEADPADTSITYQQVDKVGVAQIITNYATDLPRVDVVGQEFTARVKSLGASYGYSVQEIRAAKKAGRPIDTMRAKAAQEAILRQEAHIAWFGDKSHNIVGILDNPNTQLVVLTPDRGPVDVLPGGTRPAVATDKIHMFAGGSSTNADPNVMLRQLNAIINSPSQISKGIERPDTLLVSLNIWNLISTTKLNDASSYTVLKFLLETSPYIKKVDWVPEFEGAGDLDPNDATRQGDIIMAYKRDPDRIEMQIPMDFTQYAPQQEKLEFEVPCESRFGGVIIRRPLSIAICRNA